MHRLTRSIVLPRTRSRKEPRRTGSQVWRAAAVWRGGDSLNVSVDNGRGVWHDFTTGESGGVRDPIHPASPRRSYRYEPTSGPTRVERRRAPSEVIPQPRIHAARRGNRGSREKPGEVDRVQPVGQVLAGDLKGDRAQFSFPHVHSQTGVQGEVRANPAGVEIDFIDDLLAVLQNQRRDVAAIRLHRQPAAILGDAGDPETPGDLIPGAHPGRIALVLRHRLGGPANEGDILHVTELRLSVPTG